VPSWDLQGRRAHPLRIPLVAGLTGG
jgi:hypothetical protein